MAAAVVLALLAGGVFALGVFGGETTTLAGVPDGAQYVAHVDGAVFADDQSRTLGNAALDAAGLESVTTGTVLAAVQLQTGLGTDGLDDAVVYGRYDEAGDLDSEYAAAVVEANWSTDSVVDATTSVTDWQYETERVGDATVYRPQGGQPMAIAGHTVAPLTIAALAEGTYAVGTEAAVDDAVAVANGEAASVTGPLRETVAADDGLVTVAANVSGAWTEELDARTQGLTRLGQVRALAATYDTPADETSEDGPSEDALRVRVRMHTDGAEAARDVAAFTRGGLPVLASRLDNETAASLLNSIAVDREGTDATLVLETTIEDLREIAAHYGLVEDQR